MRHFFSAGLAVLFGVGCSGKTIDGGTGSDAGVTTGDAQPEGSASADAPADTGDGGATSIATNVQEIPEVMVSDGVTLFWINGTNGILASMPVAGGPITTLVSANVSGESRLLVADDVNVYFAEKDGVLERLPKAGGSPSALTDSGTNAATALGTQAYWYEVTGSSYDIDSMQVTVKSVPLKGGTTSVLAQFYPMTGIEDGIGVTGSTIFLEANPTGPVLDFPIAGLPDGGTPGSVVGMEDCGSFLSDTDAVYCLPNGVGTSITRIASDGTTTQLAPVIVGAGGLYASGGLSIDNSYVYWIDGGEVGTIMQVLKTGGPSSIVARDANPVALAVDATSIYWSDTGGNIKRIAK